MPALVRFKPEFAPYWLTDQYTGYLLLRYSNSEMSVWMRRGLSEDCVPLGVVDIQWDAPRGRPHTNCTCTRPDRRCDMHGWPDEETTLHGYCPEKNDDGLPCEFLEGHLKRCMFVD